MALSLCSGQLHKVYMLISMYRHGETGFAGGCVDARHRCASSQRGHSKGSTEMLVLLGQSASMVYCSSESPSPPFISSFSSSSYSSCSSNHQLAFSSFTGGQQTELSTMPSCSSAIQLYASLWGRLYSPSASTTPEWSKPHMLSFEKPPSNSPRSSSPASAGSGNFGARHEVLPGSGIAFTAGPILADSELVYDPNYIPAGGDNFSVSTDTANPAHSDVHTVSCPLTWTYADVYPHLAYIPTPEEMLADKDAWQEKLPKGRTLKLSAQLPVNASGRRENAVLVKKDHAVYDVGRCYKMYSPYFV
ncbi:unnamed protein product [Protopolystoma xenopodis]|uniref:Uncharacterized protein n=1 Tax=Protopolystoma xenopodis TaxID=117903 RepID=A0A3S5CTC7_9PLAT|nr:unnamed protein product [Protopolystoma xenopodis]